MRVVMASPEIVPFAKTGGLADVVGSLPLALEGLGVRVSLIMPAYSFIPRDRFGLKETGIELIVPISRGHEKAGVLETTIGKGIKVYFIQADKYFDRENLYGTPEGDYLDNAERFAFFSRAILELLRKIGVPDVLHVHDWQTALAPAFLKASPGAYPELEGMKTVLTIHNMGYLGLFWHLDWHLLNLDWKYFNFRFLEFYGMVSYLKGGIVFADAITTVSKKYAEEIKTLEYGYGLEGVLQERAGVLYGILNGVDYGEWNPKTDSHIKKNYGPRDLSGKMACKRDLQKAFGLPMRRAVPLIGMISRLADQKGFDLLAEVIDDIMGMELQFVLLGTGEKKYHDLFEDIRGRYQEKCGIRIGFDNSLAHKIEAGSDIFLMPSKYEPCGLNQIYSLKYGTIPVVRATGGLDDTIQEFDPATGKGNGFKFQDYSGRALLSAINRALETFKKPALWKKIIQNAMAADFSWKRSAQEYLKLYQSLV